MSSKRKRSPPETWKTKKGDEKFVAMYHEMINDISYTSLSKTARLIYMYMRDYSNGAFEFTYPYRMYKNICSKSTFSNCINELEEHGFIKLKINGKFTRTENVYNFSNQWQNYKLPKK